MEPLTIILVGLNAALGIVGWILRTMIADLKEEVKKNRQDIDSVKDQYFKKADFSEFKQELWDRLDRFEQGVRDQLHTK